MKNKSNIDYSLMLPGIIVTLLFSVSLVVNPEKGSAMVNSVFAFITTNFKWSFLLFGLFSVLFLVWLGSSRWGRIKLGAPEDKPEFSDYTWAAMVFCAGIGIAIVYWAFIEPVYYMGGPPLGVEAGSIMAAEWAGVLGQFHWGITPWAIYALPTIPIAYAIHVKRASTLRLSTACKGVIGGRAEGTLGKLINTLVIFAMIGGVGTSLGLAVPLVTALIANMLGIPESFQLQLITLTIFTSLISITVYAGLQKGIAKLADLNTYIAYFLLIFVFIAGPSIYILNLWVNSLGLMFNDFIRLSLWTDPIANAGFPEGWTVFYWAWWIAYAPMMGLFVARISRGRTIRQVVFGELIFGSFGCWVFFAIWGGYAIDVQTSGALDVAKIVSEVGTPGTIIAILSTLPAGKWLIIPIFTILCIVFLATTLNSAAFTLSAQVTKEISGHEEPNKWNRTLWAIFLGVFAVGLLATGGLTAVQLASIVVALPLMPILITMLFSLLKWLKEDYGAQLTPKTVVLETSEIISIDKTSTEAKYS
ncbi:BCCT family transporter [Serpentinicella alkaliphila]|uniref:BCCT family betaine/carnitine transporter n=1 Tax=Serpentinicella alkaliphila TaxID=1734049 RepID=A0A4R2TK02_9FIRM|nr:BCCT family transporter [Serpentinicella alkaliphila]QUH24944.1 BCCT family transporter [Serpentinicella alkaliphila]TCQ02747.1 BCCT family betaine/carnitine transporter [Serpentinicella alkaliphila]